MTDHLASLSNLWRQTLGTENEAISLACFNRVAAAYSQDHRAYHTLEHLAELIAYIPQIENKISVEDKHVLAAALVYHDIVYNIPRGEKSNEELSANIAGYDLGMLGYGEEFISRVRKIIIATETHKLADADDMVAAYFLDMDMAILGADEERYIRYMEQIRKEFSIYTDGQFYNGRLAGFIEKTLASDRIFTTVEFFDKFEEKARSNLQMEKRYLERKIQEMAASPPSPQI